MIKQMIDGMLNAINAQRPPMPHGQRITGKFKGYVARMSMNTATIGTGNRAREYIVTPSGAWIRKEKLAQLKGVRSLFG